MKKNRHTDLQGEKTVLKNIKAVLPCKNKPHFSYRRSLDTELLNSLKAESEKEQLTQESMESSLKTVAKQKTKKKRWLSALFLVINLLILVGIFFFQFLNEKPVSIADLVSSKIHWEWLAITVGLFFLDHMLDASRISIALKKLTGRFRPVLSYKSTVCCRFYDSITPLATGGQPFQIYYLNKRGLNASSATSVPLAKFIFSQLVYIIISALVLLLDGRALLLGLDVSPIIITMCYIGLGLNLFLVGSVLWLSVSKRIAPKMMLGILKLLKFLHIIKDEKAVFEKVMNGTKEYISTCRMFISSWWVILAEVFASVLFIICHYSIAFGVFCIFCGFDINMWFTFFVVQLACDLAISFIPIPGGAGTAELSFSALCKPMYVAALGASAGGIFVWAILFYRILTYYGFLIQGGFLLLYDFAIGNKKIQPMLERYKSEERRMNDAARLKEALALSYEAERSSRRMRKVKINKNGDTINEKELN